MTSRPSTSSESNPPEELIPEAPAVLSTQEDSRPGSNQHQPTIFLPDYMRAIETESRCFIEGCSRTERYRVPLATRKMLLAQYNYYVPVNNRLCDHHLIIESWNFLDSLRNNYVKEFTAKHIQDMLALKDNENSTAICFNNIDNMEDHILYKWIGFNKVQYHQLLQEVPQILEDVNGSLALVAYLIKLRTGDSDERIATLFNISKSTWKDGCDKQEWYFMIILCQCIWDQTI